jgi:hypothetical protein
MMPTIRRRALAAACCLAAFPVLALAQAQAPARSPEQLVAAVPAEVPEVHTGGSWQDGNTQGVFRALAVLVPADNTTRVYLQWIAMKQDSPLPEIVKTVPIKEIIDKKLPNAFISMEAEKEGEVIVVISSYDPASNKDQTLAFKATKPGSYAPTAVPTGGVGSGSAAPPAK